MTQKTKEQYKIELKAKLGVLLSQQWNDVFTEFQDHPNIFTPEETAEIATCSDAVRELRAELEGVKLCNARVCECPDCV